MKHEDNNSKPGSFVVKNEESSGGGMDVFEFSADPPAPAPELRQEHERLASEDVSAPAEAILDSYIDRFINTVR